MCEPLIKEFYANVVLREEELNCWIRGKEFNINAGGIDKALGLKD